MFLVAGNPPGCSGVPDQFIALSSTFTMPKVSSAILLPVLSMALAGCSLNMNPANQDPPKSSPSAQLANPASVHCISKGGKLISKKDKKGNAFNLCQLPDGSQVEEWELYRRDHS